MGSLRKLLAITQMKIRNRVLTSNTCSYLMICQNDTCHGCMHPYIHLLYRK